MSKEYSWCHIASFLVHLCVHHPPATGREQAGLSGAGIKPEECGTNWLESFLPISKHKNHGDTQGH